MFGINSLFGVFKKKHAAAAGAILYPDKIVIETRDQVKDGYWITTDKVSILPADTSDEKLGLAIRRHLHKSRIKISNPEGDSGFKKIQERYKKATGLTTLKAQMTDARYVFVLNENLKLQFCPSRNGGTQGDKRGYHFKPADNTEVQQPVNDHALGQQLREAWLRCE